MELLIIITVQAGTSRGIDTRTIVLKSTADLAVTREALFQWTLDQLPDNLKGAPVLFYSVEPNRVLDGPGWQGVVTSGATS